MNWRARRTSQVSLILAALLLVPLPFSQSVATSGTISGTVSDPQGRAVAGANVTVHNSDLTWNRSASSDETGHFNFPLLTTGAYTLDAKAPGMKMKSPARITLGVGSTVRVDLRLAIAGTSEKVTVSGSRPTVEGNTVLPAVNKQEPDISNSIAGLTVTYLPNRDRDFSQFAQLAAGAEASPEGGGLIVAGQRPDATMVEIDGTDFTDPLQGGARGSHDSGFFFPQTVVREFEIVHAGEGAEIGGSNAGFVNVATKEGSNKFHGEAFYIGRPRALSSAGTFGHSLNNLQNEFGGSVGGPIKKNHAFFYFGLEQDFLHVPYWTLFQPQAPGITVPASLTALQTQTVEHSNPTALFGRTDVLVGSRNTLKLEFNFNRVDASNLSTGSTRSDAPATHSDSLNGDSEWARGSFVTLFGTKIVNQALVQWARDYRNLQPNDFAPEIVINGFGTLGGDSISPQRYTSSRVEFGDDVALTRGSYLFHFGGTFAYDPARDQHEANLNGRFDFDSLADYLADDPRRYQQTFIIGDPVYNATVHQFGLYATIKIPLAKNLTLSAGLRWDGQWKPAAGPSECGNCADYANS